MSRKNVRMNRRMKAWKNKQGISEERIALRNKFGIKDPTPYEAVKNMVQKQKLVQAY